MGGAVDGVDGAVGGVDGAVDGVDGAVDGVGGAVDGAWMVRGRCVDAYEKNVGGLWILQNHAVNTAWSVYSRREHAVNTAWSVFHAVNTPFSRRVAPCPLAPKISRRAHAHEKKQRPRRVRMCTNARKSFVSFARRTTKARSPKATFVASHVPVEVVPTVHDRAR